MAKILVIRLSSFGDVALLVPVVYSVASRYPQVRIEVMTRQAFVPLFSRLGFNISALPVDTKKKHKGISGILKIAGKALTGNYTHVADVHDVLRSKVVRHMLRLTFAKVRKIDKGRVEKRLMIQSKDTSVPLKHATMRYMDVFDRLGFHADIIFESFFDFNLRNLNDLKDIISEKRGSWIGIAPFAQHQGKIYPPKKTEEIIEHYSKQDGYTIFLLGGGKKEIAVLKEWEKKYPNTINCGGKLSLQRELLLISYLDVMISMDSANMHLASLVKTPVVSIWGATHPALGFYGFNQDIQNAVQSAEACRPCSVFGDTPCIFAGKEEYKCMKQIECKTITSKIDTILKDKI